MALRTSNALKVGKNTVLLLAILAKSNYKKSITKTVTMCVYTPQKQVFLCKKWEAWNKFIFLAVNL